MADTAALVVALSAQLTKFEKDMKDAGRIAEKGVRDIERSTANVNPFAGLTQGLTAFLTAGGFLLVARQVKELIDQVDRLGDSAQIVGVTAQQFQELQFAIIASGFSAEKADQFMQRFARSLSDAQRNTGELAEIFKANQIAAQDLTVPQALGKFADLIRNAKTQQDALNLAILVGGRQAAPQLVAALQGGADGLRAMSEEAQRLGVVLDEDVTSKADEISKAYEVMSLQVVRFFQRIAVNVGDTIKQIIEDIQSAPQRTQFVRIRPPGPETVVPDPTVDKFKKLIEAQQKRVELLNAEGKTLGENAGVQAQYRTQIELEQQAKAQEIALTPDRIAAIQQEAAAVGRATEELAKQKFAFHELQSASQELGSALSDAFKGAIIEGQKFDVVLNNLVKRLESKAFDKLFDLAFAPQGAATSSVFTQLLQSLTGKMAGGPVSRGQPFLVGEKGPELFVPNQSGMIVPNKAMTAKGGTPGDRNLNVSVDVTGANGDQAIEDAVNRGVQRAVQQSVSIVNNTAPGRQLRYSQLGT
jgi:hypothetical protein